MIGMVFLFLVIFSFCAFIFSYFYYVMETVTHSDKYAYGSYKDFKKVLDRYAYRVQKPFLESYCVEGSLFKITHFKFKFKNMYMLTSPVSFVKINMWLYKEIKKYKKSLKNTNKEKAMWRE